MLPKTALRLLATPSARAFLFLAALFASLPVHAQVPDTTGVVPDSLASDTVVPDRARPDTLALRQDTLRATPARPLLGFRADEGGMAVGDTLPARRPALDATELLADVPGTFVYAFGTAGWPNAWSPFGLVPRDVALRVDGRPFDDLLTGMPRFDLLPLAYTEPLRLGAGGQARATAVHAAFRAYDAPRPLTELRYLAGGEGLQSIDAVHVQNRRRTLFGRPGMLQLLGAYSGRAAAGTYAGSRLRRARQTLARLRYAQAGWSFELVNLHNRRNVGALGGVAPDPLAGAASIFNPTLARVRDAEAERRTVRNDLAATLRAPLLRALPDPLTLSAYWTAETFRYRDQASTTDDADTLGAQTDRYGVWAEQRLPVAGRRLALRADGWLDVLHGDSSSVGGGAGRLQLHLAARDSLRLGGGALVVEARLHRYDGALHPGASATLARPLGRLRLLAAATLAGQPGAWIDTHPFGPFVVPDGEAHTGRLWAAAAGVALAAGPYDARLLAFGTRTEHPHDLYATGHPDTVDVVAARRADTPFHRAGLGADLGWRRTARRGLYATLQPSLFAFLNPGASPDHRRVARTLPTLFARARLGARYRLFRGDLDLDLSLQGRFWTAMRSRALHPQTGLLVVPVDAADVLGPSGLLDVVAEANLRAARLFVVYENVLGGTVLQAGTLLVPAYPYPAQRLRFGVYWPIVD